MADHNFKKFMGFYQNWYLRIFEVSGFEYNIRFPKFKMADPVPNNSSITIKIGI